MPQEFKKHLDKIPNWFKENIAILISLLGGTCLLLFIPSIILYVWEPSTANLKWIVTDFLLIVLFGFLSAVID